MLFCCCISLNNEALDLFVANDSLTFTEIACFCKVSIKYKIKVFITKVILLLWFLEFLLRWLLVFEFHWKMTRTLSCIICAWNCLNTYFRQCPLLLTINRPRNVEKVYNEKVWDQSNDRFLLPLDWREDELLICCFILVNHIPQASIHGGLGVPLPQVGKDGPTMFHPLLRSCFDNQCRRLVA